MHAPSRQASRDAAADMWRLCTSHTCFDNCARTTCGFCNSLPHARRGNKFRFANHSAKPNCKVSLRLGSGVRAEPLARSRSGFMAGATTYP